MKIDIKPLKYNIEIDNYGSFEVSPFGAGAEAEINIKYRELDEVSAELEKYKDIQEKLEKKETLDLEDEKVKEFSSLIDKTNAILKELKEITLQKLDRVIKGEKKTELFNDFTYTQLMEIYREAVKE